MPQRGCSMRAASRVVVPWAVGLVIVGVSASAAAEVCREHFDSTFALIEKVIFERRGCLDATCHSGPTPAGGLDLTPGIAYEHLVDVAPQSVSTELYPGLVRVLPGSKAYSLLWLNLAGASLPLSWKAPLRPMPLGAPPLTFEELELVRLWIEYGATRDGVVPGSGDLVDACLPPPRPLETEPLPPPPAGVGAQIRAPRQTLSPRSEREVCFTSYYDLSDQVPPEFRGPGGGTFRYKRTAARQDPHSHHGVVISYGGTTSIHDPIWGPFTCAGGAHGGAPCEPTDPDACGADARCGSVPVPSVACIGYGPGDATVLGSQILFSTMGTVASDREGIYSEAPLKGVLVWNSHAFNTTDEPAKLDMWLNFEFAAPEEQQRPLRGFIDTSQIGAMHVPAFATEEVCHRYVLPAGIRLLGLTSHVHQRGKRFRIFDGHFACAAGPHAGAACSPFGPDPGLPSPDLCAGAACVSRLAPRGGDCNRDLTVTIDELVLAVRIALGEAHMSACVATDVDTSGTVTVDELILAVASSLSSGWRDPEASLLYTSLTYSDPLVLSFDPPRLVARGTPAPERTLTYCALYDNGFADPDAVKRNSRVPSNSGPCRPTHCAEGAIGRTCAADAECDTAPGAGDGMCDACTVSFGITTDDEMFVLIGSFVGE